MPSQNWRGKHDVEFCRQTADEWNCQSGDDTDLPQRIDKLIDLVIVYASSFGEIMLRRTLVLTAVLVLSHSASAIQSAAQPQTWVTDGTVDTITQSGNTIYAGGLFSNVGSFTGCGNFFAADTGAIDPSFPKFDGQVLCAIPDGAGGMYAGGLFQRVGGSAHFGLVRIKADKTVDNTFAPTINGQVNCMVLSGNKLFAGGNIFPSMVNQSGVALLDATTGAPTEFAKITGGVVLSLATDGTTLFCGGSFNSAQNLANDPPVPRNRACSFDIATGSINAFDPNCGGPVNALVLSGTTLYMGGSFGFVNNGAVFANVVGVNTTTGAAGSFFQSPGQVFAMLLSGNTLYVGGNFLHNLRAYDVTTNFATAFDPNFNGRVTGLALSGTTLYATGTFTGVNFPAVTRNRAAAVDVTTGAVLPFDPNLANQGGNQAAILPVAGGVFIGGTYTFIKATTRRNIAAFDATTGIVTAFDPNCDQEVFSLAANGTNVYAGGRFASVNGGAVLRTGLAAFDPATGAVSATFNPNLAFGVVNTILLSGNTLYAGGTLQITSHNNLAAFDATTGAVSNWNPGVNGQVNALALSGTTLYFGGVFSDVNGTPRSNIAAVSTSTGAATAFDPSVNFAVNSLLVNGSTVYAGGLFSSVNVSTTPAMRNQCAAFNATSGMVTAFDAQCDPFAGHKVKAMTLLGSSLLLGGDFQNVGAQINPAFAAVDPTTGTASTFYLNVGESFSAPVNTFFLSSTALYLGGAFPGGPDNGGHPFLAAFSLNNPTVTSLSPAATAVGGPAFTLTVTGTNFNVNSVVNWNNSPRPTTVVNLTTLTAVITAADIASLGTADVKVVTPGSPATSTLPFGIGNAPKITSVLSSTFPAGAPFMYTLIATGDAPIVFGASGLPAGLTFASPNISGTVATVGTTMVTLTATNAFGVDSKQLALTFTGAAPVITSALTADASAGVPFTYTLTATGNPVPMLSVKDLPAGLTFTSPSITGIPAAVGVVQVTLTATNAVGTVTKTLELSIAGAAPAITSALTVDAPAGVPFTYTLTATGNPVPVLNATSLPAGLVFTSPTISGRATAVGSTPVTVTAANIVGTDTKTLLLNFTAPFFSGPGKSEADTDGDGFLDELEASFNTNPYDPMSTPIGNNPAVTAPLTSTLSVKLDFGKAGNDSLSLSGTLPVPPGFSPAGKSVLVDVGGIIRTISLSAPKTPFKLAKPGKTGTAKFTLKLSKDSFQADLVDEGLTNVTQKGSFVFVATQVIFNDTVYSKKSNLVYKATKGKSGSATQAK